MLLLCSMWAADDCPLGNSRQVVPAVFPKIEAKGMRRYSKRPQQEITEHTVSLIQLLLNLICNSKQKGYF